MRLLFAVILSLCAMSAYGKTSVSDSLNVVSPMDTLETSEEHLKVVLFEDNTWKYIKSPGFAPSTADFKMYWHPELINPYKFKYDDLDEFWTLVLVDTVANFHSPYKGKLQKREKFGVYRNRRHLGVDIPLKEGEPVMAVFEGQVRTSKSFDGYGELVVIRHESGIETFYAHLSKRMVAVGDWVKAGGLIGFSGSTGTVAEPHLHFEARYKGFAFDPESFIDFEKGELKTEILLMKRKSFTAENLAVQDFTAEISNIGEDKADSLARLDKAMKAAQTKVVETPAEPEKPKAVWHTVKRGDTLYALSIQYNTSVTAICKLNRMYSKATLKIGQKLRVK